MKFDRKKFFASYRAAFGPLNQSQVVGLQELLGFIEADPAVTDLRWAAYMLATVKHECADKWTPVEERGPRQYFDQYEPNTAKGKSLGNKVMGDGYRTRGRGYVQITGVSNYDKMGKRIGVDLTSHPELALVPEVAYKIMSNGMRDGIFTGRSLEDCICGKTCDYLKARRIINGQDRAILIQGYAQQLEGVLKSSLEA